jgi:hypothetical protein
MYCAMKRLKRTLFLTLRAENLRFQDLLQRIDHDEADSVVATLNPLIQSKGNQRWAIVIDPPGQASSHAAMISDFGVPHHRRDAMRPSRTTHEPSGDEKFFSLARQARCIPIVATQSISSLRSTLSGESWRTLLQGLRTKIFLALSDDFSARMAADLCGKAECLRPSYSITEAGQDAQVSMLTGRPAAHRTTVSAAKTYNLLSDYVFQPKVFAELQNCHAVVLPYDGLNPVPPTYCYLKPHYLDVPQQLPRSRRSRSPVT